MTYFETPADRRDEFAADRDDVAECRDLASAERDDAADLRDTRADRRAEEADNRAGDLDERLAQVRRQILDRLARLENTTFDEADWPDFTPADLARLRAHATDQRSLAALDRTAIRDLLDELQNETEHRHADRSDAAENRLAAARDRHAAHGDRRDSAHDRNDSARDRAQAAIERQQVDPAEHDNVDLTEGFHGGGDELLTDHVAQSMDESRRRIEASREILACTGDHSGVPATKANDADSARQART